MRKNGFRQNEVTYGDIQEEMHKLIEARAVGMAQLAQATGRLALQWRAELVYIERKLKFFRGRALAVRPRTRSGWITQQEHARFMQEAAQSLLEAVHGAPLPRRRWRYRTPLDLHTGTTQKRYEVFPLNQYPPKNPETPSK